MSLYSKVLTEEPSIYDKCPAFLERYLSYLSTFENKHSKSVLEAGRCLREFLQYIHHCNVTQKKPSTKDAYRDIDISCMKLPEVCEVSKEDVEAYLCFLDTVSRNAASTVSKKLGYLRHLYSYLETNADELGIRLKNGNPIADISNPPKSKNPVQVLSPKQITRLMDGATGETAERDKAIILLIATTGLTSTEVAALNREDIDMNANIIQVRSNRNKSRSVYMTYACKQQILRYLNDLQMKGDTVTTNALFVSYGGYGGHGNGSRLTARSIQIRISKAASVAGLGAKSITANGLRDSAVVMLMQGRSEQEKLQLLYHLGYSSPSSLRRFEHLLSTPSGDTKAMQTAADNSELSKIGLSKNRRRGNE